MTYKSIYIPKGNIFSVGLFGKHKIHVLEKFVCGEKVRTIQTTISYEIFITHEKSWSYVSAIGK